MSKPWSKLKSRVEALWDPALSLAIHCTAYTNSVTRRDHRLSRHWLMLEKAVIWDFPGQFLDEIPARGRKFTGAEHGWANGGSVIGDLLRDYLDRPVSDLFAPFEDDGWELTDILRAADRRLGKRILLDWARGLDDAHPAHRVLRARFEPA